jgi:cysteine-rich repeat protein
MRKPPASCVVAAVLALGCRTPTQVTVDVSTDLACPDVLGTLITVGDPAAVEGASPVTSTEECATGDVLNRIGSLVVVPSDEQDAAFGVKIVAGVDSSAETCTEANGYKGCIVARRGMRFVPHEELVLPIPLRDACKNVPCTATTTCVFGRCYSAMVADPSLCVDPDACGEDTLNNAGGEGGGPPGGGCGDGQVDVAGGEQCDDGNTDSNDGCSASCAYELSDGCGAVALAVGTDPVVLSGDTTNTAADDSSSCGGNSAGEYIVTVAPEVAGTLAVTVTAADYAVILWMKDSCPGGTELECDSSGTIDLAQPVSPGETYYVGIDGSSGDEGNFDMQLVVQP